MIRWLLLCLTFALPVQAENIIASLSQNRIGITTNFDGTEIIVFGAVDRSSPRKDDTDYDLIITVAGPERIETIRRKDRRAGVWVNVESQRLGQTPTFYSVSTTRPIALNDLADQAWGITTHERILPEHKGDPAREALIRLRETQGLYKTRHGTVSLLEDTLFRTEISLPANLTEGAYRTRIFLLKNGEIIDTYRTEIDVRKVGLERKLFVLSNENPAIYGLLAISLAVLFGWLASEAFRLLRLR